MTAKKKLNGDLRESIKTWLRRSGFPFENDVESVVRSTIPDARIIRQYRFNSVDENQRQTLRSVDFVVQFGKPVETIPSPYWGQKKFSASVHAIIEAKRFENGRMMFLADEGQAPSFVSWPKLIPGYEEEKTQGPGKEHDSYHRELDQLAMVPKKLPIAHHGVVIDESNAKGEDRKSTDGYSVQVLGGTIDMVGRSYNSLIKDVDRKPDNADARIYVPIVVTNNAPLLVRKGVSSAEVDRTKDTSELYAEVPLVVMSAPDFFTFRETLRGAQAAVNGHSCNHARWRDVSLVDAPVLFASVDGLKSILYDLFEGLNRIV